MNLTRLLLAFAFVAACADEAPTIIPPVEPVLVGRNPRDSLPDTHPVVEGIDIASRGPRRLSVSQLERSIEAIGSLEAGSVVLPESLAQALGQPDWFRVTEESLDPSPLFMKFMMDLGTFACTGLSDYDPVRPVDDRVLTRYTDIDENIRHILLRFTGIDGPMAEPYLPRLRAVHGAAQGSARPNGQWEAVCLAIFTSPEFLLY